MDQFKLEFVCDKSIRLSLFLQEKLNRKFYRNLKSSGATILVNGNPLELYKEININDKVEIYYQRDKNELDWDYDETPLDIYYEDEHYLVCFKRHGILTIPTKGEPKSLYQQLLFHLKDTPSTISILNRLDKETSGLVLVAKDRYSAFLMNPAKEKIKRKYVALTSGHIPCDMNIVAYMDKEESSNKRIITKNGKYSKTMVRILNYYKNHTLCELELTTGRTHQIRLHLNSIGYPILGDNMYGYEKASRMYLESVYLEYVCPYTNKLMTFKVKEDYFNE